MADIFEELIPRLVLNTETDADSPDNETTYGGLRKLVEGFMISMIATGVSGTVTGISTVTLTDAGNFTTDQCNNWSLIMTSGDAVGDKYTITDTTTNTLVCAENLETAGVAIGDTYIVLYDLIANADGHDHDGVNSKSAVLADDSITTAKYYPASVDQDAVGASAIGQGELKTTTSETTVTLSDTNIKYSAAVGGGAYAFGEYIKQTNTGASDITYNGLLYPALGTSYVRPKAAFTRTGGTAGVGYFRVYYVQASGELHWIFLLMKSGEILATWEQPDHPAFGNMGMFLDHPFEFPFNGEKESDCEVVVVIPTIEQVEQIRTGTIPLDSKGDEDYLKPTGSFIDVFQEKFDIEESNELEWPDVPVTVALPRIHEGQIVDDWRLFPQQKYNEETKLYEPTKVKPIKRVIEKPDNVTRLAIKERKNV